MKLSAKLICYHLQKSFSMHTSRLDTSPPFPALPALKRTPFFRMDVFTLSQIRIFSSLFIIPKYSVPDDWKNLSELRINSAKHVYHPEDIPVNIVFNRIQDIFILYDQWNQSLMDSRLRNASIQELLDLTASIIPNPMMLIGMDFTIIASRDWNLSDLSNSVLGSTENSWAIVDSLKQDHSLRRGFL